jgi:alpha-L-fucosidase
MTMNGTWGYKSYDNNWKPTATLVRNLIDIASKGGNYLLNVGPKADGTFPQESIDRLKEVGAWMKVNGEAVYGTFASPLKPLAWGRCTKKESKGNTVLYLSVFDWPANGKLVVPGVTGAASNVQLLGGGVLKSVSAGDGITIDVPAKPLNEIATVIKVELKGKL